MSMIDRGPAVQTISSEEAGDEVRRLVHRVTREGARVVVTEAGVPVAAIVAMDAARSAEDLATARARRFAVLDEMGAAFAGVSADEIERETAKAVAEVRAEMRAER